MFNGIPLHICPPLTRGRLRLLPRNRLFALIPNLELLLQANRVPRRITRALISPSRITFKIQFLSKPSRQRTSKGSPLLVRSQTPFRPSACSISEPLEMLVSS
jgi:hypothetical protein